MNTLGFGDITPTNYAEKIFCVFLIYITCTMFAYIINSIGIILQNLNKDNREFKRYLNVINGYLRQNNLNLNLRIKIRNYLEYTWQEEKISNVEEAHEIINKRLSKSLKDELMLNSNGIVLKSIPLLTRNFSEETLKQLSYEMKECNMTPGDVIYNINEFDDYLYIIRKGKVELFIETQKRNNPFTVVKTLTNGDLLGEISFFKETARETSARSVTFTSLYVIKRESFINILKKNSYDYEIFCYIKDNMNLYNNYDQLFLVCNSCKTEKHSSVDCPLLHLILSRQRVISRYNFSRFQEREPFIKKKKKKMNSMRQIKRIRANAFEFMSYASNSEIIMASDSNLNFNEFPRDNEHFNSFTHDTFEDKNEINDKIIVENYDLKKNEKILKEQNSEISCSSNSMKHLNKRISKNVNDSDSAMKTLRLQAPALEDFCDNMKEFDFYFSNNNAGQIIEKYNKITLENLKRKNLLRKRIASFWAIKTPMLPKEIGSGKLKNIAKNLVEKVKENPKSWFTRKKKVKK